MNTQQIQINLKKQIGELHRRRHPSKGEVVEFPGFAEAVERRTLLLRKLSAHSTKMPHILALRDRYERTRRRWAHIRNNVENGSALMAVSLDTIGGSIEGVTFFDDGTETTIPISDPVAIKAGFRSLAALARENNDYTVLHDQRNMTLKLAELGIKVPDMPQTIDLGFTVVAVTGETMPTSVMTGEMVGVYRSKFSSYSEYLIAVAKGYIALDDIAELKARL